MHLRVPKMFLQWKKSLIAGGSSRPPIAVIARYIGSPRWPVSPPGGAHGSHGGHGSPGSPGSQLTWERHEEQGACYLTKPLGLFYPVRVMLLDAQIKNVWQKCGVDIFQKDGFTVHAWKLKCWFRLTKILAGLRKQL